MYTLKEKVTDKLSRLFSDSSLPGFPPHNRQSPWARPGGRSSSSIFAFVLPSASFPGFGSKKYEGEIKPIESHPIGRNSTSSSWHEQELEGYSKYDQEDDLKEGPNHHEENRKQTLKGLECGERLTVDSFKESEQPGSRPSNYGSEGFEDATGRISFEKLMPNLADDSLFISPNLYEFLESSLPNIVKGCQWVLLYSTERDGISLCTLIRKTAGFSGPCLLITGDMEGAIFGGLLECPLMPTAKKKYQGTNQTFVFTTIYGAPRLFRPTGANRFFYLCLNDLLAFGGGGNFALRLDGDLLTGSSGPCDTFGNLCLAHNQEFEPKNIELWGFTHSSRYLA